MPFLLAVSTPTNNQSLERKKKGIESPKNMAGGGKTWLDACTLPCGSIRGIPVRVHREFREEMRAFVKEENKSGFHARRRKR